MTRVTDEMLEAGKKSLLRAMEFQEVRIYPERVVREIYDAMRRLEPLDLGENHAQRAYRADLEARKG